MIDGPFFAKSIRHFSGQRIDADKLVAGGQRQSIAFFHSIRLRADAATDDRSGPRRSAPAVASASPTSCANNEGRDVSPAPSSKPFDGSQEDARFFANRAPPLDDGALVHDHYDSRSAGLLGSQNRPEQNRESANPGKSRTGYSHRHQIVGKNNGDVRVAGQALLVGAGD